MTVRAIVAPAFTRHLLIKLTDWKGKGGREGGRGGGRAEWMISFIFPHPLTHPSLPPFHPKRPRHRTGCPLPPSPHPSLPPSLLGGGNEYLYPSFVGRAAAACPPLLALSSDRATFHPSLASRRVGRDGRRRRGRRRAGIRREGGREGGREGKKGILFVCVEWKNSTAVESAAMVRQFNRSQAFYPSLPPSLP